MEYEQRALGLSFQGGILIGAAIFVNAVWHSQAQRLSKTVESSYKADCHSFNLHPFRMKVMGALF